MRESTCFDVSARWNAESAPRIWARAAFSSNDPVVVLDAVAESAVAGVFLVQADKRRLPTASKVMPPLLLTLPPWVSNQRKRLQPDPRSCSGSYPVRCESRWLRSIYSRIPESPRPSHCSHLPQPPRHRPRPAEEYAS